MQKNNLFVFFSSSTKIANELKIAVGELGILIHEQPDPEVLIRYLNDEVKVIFLDYVPDEAENAEEKFRRARHLARLLKRHKPELPCVAIGYLETPEAVVAALRARVYDFVELNSPDKLRRTVDRILKKSIFKVEDKTHFRSVLVLGVRSGIGSTILSVHLSSILQDLINKGKVIKKIPGSEKLSEEKPDVEAIALHNRICLLDLGIPVADCALYLDINSNFDFEEGVRNLNRLDNTMLMSAMAHHSSGISVLPLPSDLERLSDVSHSDSLFLIERLQGFFGGLVIDAGPTTKPEFLADLIRLADETWLITDQSVGALVSLSDMVNKLERQGITLSDLSLVVNRYNVKYGLSAKQIADQFNLELKGILPDRTLAIMRSTNQGRLLHQESATDPYIKALTSMANTLVVTSDKGDSSNTSLGWLKSFFKLDSLKV